MSKEKFMFTTEERILFSLEWEHVTSEILKAMKKKGIHSIPIVSSYEVNYNNEEGKENE